MRSDAPLDQTASSSAISGRADNYVPMLFSSRRLRRGRHDRPRRRREGSSGLGLLLLLLVLLLLGLLLTLVLGLILTLLLGLLLTLGAVVAIAHSVAEKRLIPVAGAERVEGGPGGRFIHS